MPHNIMLGQCSIRSWMYHLYPFSTKSKIEPHPLVTLYKSEHGLGKPHKTPPSSLQHKSTKPMNGQEYHYNQRCLAS